ncbi:MAG: radical SAM family heme chaperone HemW [Firmicutes bacterium]|nr:radical SAM family heme chaperone HemW [Bacillota bacterium]
MAAGIYIHIPFCLKKCYYCDFFSKAIDDPEIRKVYTKALLKEITFYGKRYGKSFKADSIFFGGGTPSLMEPELIEKIILALKANFDIAEDTEISMECNPATATLEKLKGYKKAGVNRLSIGAQSFKDELLEGLGRLHKTQDTLETVKLARRAGIKNISLDLMFAIPGLGGITWRRTLKAAARLKPTHISFYSLEIAEGTEFGRRVKAGTMRETLVEIDRQMYRDALEILKKKGYEPYEISNAALPGMESRHNLKYWNFEDYLSFGAGAHSFVKGVRYSNIDNIEEYIKLLQRQDFSKENTLGNSQTYAAGCVDNYHINSFEDNVSEYVFTALRTRKGVDFANFENRFKNSFWDIYQTQRMEFEKYVKDGYAVSDNKHIALTEKGINISNKIMALFV